MDRRAWWATVHGVANSWTQQKWISMHKDGEMRKDQAVKRCPGTELLINEGLTDQSHVWWIQMILCLNWKEKERQTSRRCSMRRWLWRQHIHLPFDPGATGRRGKKDWRQVWGLGLALLITAMSEDTEKAGKGAFTARPGTASCSLSTVAFAPFPPFLQSFEISGGLLLGFNSWNT